MNGRKDVAIVGVHATAQQRRSGRTGLALIQEATNAALADAGLTSKDVDGYVAFTFPAGNGVEGPGDGNIAYQFGQPFGLIAQNSGAMAVLIAAAAIRSGNANVVIIPAGGAPTSEPAGGGDKAAAQSAAASYTRPQFEFTEWTGSMTPAQFALVARRHMHEHGSTREQFARIAAEIRNHGNINPEAVMFQKGDWTPEKILAARTVADPFTLPMCSLVNDGASCIVVTSAERARDCRKAPVWVLGGAMRYQGNSYFEAPSLAMMEGREQMIEGFRRAGVRHDDTDIVMVYDHFAHAPIMQLETLGFCNPGEGGSYVPEVMGLDAKHPICPDGGNLSYSHNMIPYNFKPIEIVRQFRNDVPDLCPNWRQGEHTYDRRICRKVRDPKLAVACGPQTEARHSFVLLAKD
jgi:acetyl-CoA acetyltransferase